MAFIILTVTAKGIEDVASSYSQAFETDKMVDVIDNPTSLTGSSTFSYPDATGGYESYYVSEDLSNITSAADGSVKKAVLSLTSAQIKALNSTPIDIVAAPGAGKALIPEAGYVFLDAGTGYATNLDIDVVLENAPTVPILSGEDALSGTSDKYTMLKLYSLGTTAATIVANKAIQVTEIAGNPATGTGTAKVVVYYKEVTLES